MRTQRKSTIIVVGGALAIASVGYGLGTQADDGTAVADESSQNGERGARLMVERGAPCGFSGLADELGVDDNKLEQALRDFSGDDEDGVRADFAKDLADALGISAGKVTAALDQLHQRREQRFEQRQGSSEMPPPPGRLSFHFGVPLRELASELGVSRADLRKALREVGKQATDRVKEHQAELARFLADRFDLDVDKVTDALGTLGPPIPFGHRGGLPDHPPAL